MKSYLTDDTDQQVVHAMVQYRRYADELAAESTARVFRFCLSDNNKLKQIRDESLIRVAR